MADSAYILAALRAGRTLSLSQSDRAATEVAAGQLGRRLVEVHAQPGRGQTALGFAEGYEPNPDDDVFVVRRLSPVPLVALAACLGLCWTRRDAPPYPGEAVPVDCVLQVVRELGGDRSHTVGAMRHELVLAGLIRIDHDEVSLGPAVAAWTDAQVDTLRRFADVLPGAEDA